MELLTKASCSDAVTDREKANLDIAYRAALEAIVMLKKWRCLYLLFKNNGFAVIDACVVILSTSNAFSELSQIAVAILAY